jgi:hypothetical protein
MKKRLAAIIFSATTDLFFGTGAALVGGWKAGHHRPAGHA